jgi:hypothetical protein
MDSDALQSSLLEAAAEYSLKTSEQQLSRMPDCFQYIHTSQMHLEIIEVIFS